MMTQKCPLIPSVHVRGTAEDLVVHWEKRQ